VRQTERQRERAHYTYSPQNRAAPNTFETFQPQCILNPQCGQCITQLRENTVAATSQILDIEMHPTHKCWHSTTQPHWLV
jgi:bacterioferritin-associated ferredoxin